MLLSTSFDRFSSSFPFAANKIRNLFIIGRHLAADSTAAVGPHSEKNESMERKGKRRRHQQQQQPQKSRRKKIETPAAKVVIGRYAPQEAKKEKKNPVKLGKKKKRKEKKRTPAHKTREPVECLGARPRNGRSDGFIATHLHKKVQRSTATTTSTSTSTTTKRK